MDLYYWPTPNGWKISIMLEECAVPYKVKWVNIGLGEQFRPKFLKIAPNNRMPALVDPDGPGGTPIAIFESGAILQYLGEKTGQFYPEDLRARTEVDQWLFWQMANLGPMCGQAHHFRGYAKGKSRYGEQRYTNEVNRLYGVMNKQLRGRAYLCGDYSIADMAAWPWVLPYKRQGQDMADFPHLYKWFKRMGERPAVQRGIALGAELRNRPQTRQEQDRARKILFGQRAR
ncbi:MAG: glutathione S-transferase family protein [Alphaproteobacteria bacterium]|nr:MAG: glutathione S-transferase family protein [Alphaproteobacteria bacterium]